MPVLSAKDIATTVQGSLEGDGGVEIEQAGGLEEATARHLSFFHNVKYIRSLEATKAGVVLIPEKLEGVQLPQGKTFIRVKNPQWAFAQVLGLFDRERQKHPRGISAKAEIDPKASVDPSAGIGAFVVIEAGVTIGAGTVIYPGSYIGHGSKVGANCIVYPNVVLREDTQVGDRVIIHAGTVLGADGYGFATIGGRHQKIPQIGRVVIEDDVEIGANVTIDRATTGETRVGAGTKIDNLVHLAHNVQTGRDCLIVAQVGVSGSTKLGNRVTLAGQVGVVGHLTIGDGAIVTAQSGIMNNVEPGEILFGSPARPHREAMKLEALFGKLPELYDAIRAIKKKLELNS
jgi:UDP-3-O-[3-hydroxymyristoyl] glucosamine N-acyltransferase